MNMASISIQELQTRLEKNNIITQQEAWGLFDSLEPVQISELRGKWKGSEITSGHPMDGMLEATGWYGKFFETEEKIFPLLFINKNGVFVGNPALMPIKLFETAPRWLVKILFKIASHFIKT